MWLAAVLAVLLTAVLLAGTVIAGAIPTAALQAGTPNSGALQTGGGAAGLGANPAPAPVSSAEALRARPAPSPRPVRTCSIAAAAADPDLGTLAASVINAETGEVLFDRDGSTPRPTASVLKLLTAAAALETLGPDARFTTRVLDGPRAGSIVLVGGGDPTLATTPESFYDDAPLLADLARDALARYDEVHPGTPITRVILDATLWDPADKWDATWPASDRADGYQAEVTALMVDGDRQDPTVDTTPRGTDPVRHAGDAFVAAAGLAGVTLTTGSGGGEVLAEVRSQPLSALIRQMLMTSDNTLGEMLARATSLALGDHGSAASLADAIPAALEPLEIPGTGSIVIRDGSGTSPENRVPPLFVARLMAEVDAGLGELDVIADGLPVGGRTGDLSDRFTGDNAVAAGRVVAKPGWIDSQRSLAGIVHAADGTPLAFAFYALGDPITYAARAAIDTLVAGAYRCGNALSDDGSAGPRA